MLMHPPPGDATLLALPAESAARMLADMRSAILLFDAQGIQYANPMALALFRLRAERAQGRSVLDLVAPGDQDRVAEQLKRRLAGEPGLAYDVRFARADGSQFDGRIWGQHLQLAGRDAVILTITEVTELKDALRLAQWNANMLAQTEALSRAGSYELRWPEGHVQLSAGLCSMVGTVPGPPALLSEAPWIHSAEREAVMNSWRTAVVGQPFELEHAVQVADGSLVPVLQRGVLQVDPDRPACWIGVATLQDISEQREAQRRIEELINFDEITGLANRSNLLQQIDAAIQASIWDDRGFSLVSIEVPRIAEIAATMGFGAGDAMAMAIAARLQDLSLDHESVAHLGGSEFALMIRHRADQGMGPTLQRSNDLKLALEQPLQMADSDVFPVCRIGIAGFPADGGHASPLLEAAQTARLGTSAAQPIALFQAASNARALREMQLDTALRQALPRGELHLVYQPQVCLSTGAIVGAEALLRWQSPEWGAVSPSEFIPIAERSGLVALIGDWVIRETCLQTVRWQQAGLPTVRVGVNISPVQFQLGDVTDRIRQILAETGAHPNWLGVELTEGSLLHDNDRVSATLADLKAMGIEISLDDFGTGFSSLSRLRSLPIDVLKVDRSFVSDVTAAAESASVTRSIINLAHGLQIKVLAEGVETEGQLSMLVVNGCDQIQGFFFSKAVSPDDFAQMVLAKRELPEPLTRRHARSRTLLLVDDEENIVTALKRLFRRDGYRILTANSGPAALELLAANEVDVIISDQRMPGMTGVEFLRNARKLCPDTVRMTLSGFTDLQSIIDAVNEGAVYKFLTKPWDDDRLREHVAQAFHQKELADENHRLQHEVAGANADMAALNLKLEQMLDRQREQAELIEASAGGVRDMVDTLPAAIFALDPEGLLAYMNPAAVELVPQAMADLGGEPGPVLRGLLDTLRSARGSEDALGLCVTVSQQSCLAWMRRLPDPAMARGDMLVLVPTRLAAAP
jgi:PAS domain S-box-containing protein/diguanylate cyclase (GGDEF)-like protein